MTWGASSWGAYACAPWSLVSDLFGLLVDEVFAWTGTPPRWFLPFLLGTVVGAGVAWILA